MNKIEINQYEIDFILKYIHLYFTNMYTDLFV